MRNDLSADYADYRRLNRTFTRFGKMDMPILLISTCYGKKQCPFLLITLKSYSYANYREKMSGSCTKGPNY